MNKKCLGLILLVGIVGIFSEIQANDQRLDRQSPPPNPKVSLSCMENRIDNKLRKDNTPIRCQKLMVLCQAYYKAYSSYGKGYRESFEVQRYVDMVAKYISKEAVYTF
jgi:hypothetical protein